MSFKRAQVLFLKPIGKGSQYTWLVMLSSADSLSRGEAHTGVITNMPSLADSLTLQQHGQGQDISGWPLASLCLAGFLATGRHTLRK